MWQKCCEVVRGVAIPLCFEPIGISHLQKTLKILGKTREKGWKWTRFHPGSIKRMKNLYSTETRFCLIHTNLFVEGSRSLSILELNIYSLEQLKFKKKYISHIVCNESMCKGAWAKYEETDSKRKRQRESGRGRKQVNCYSISNSSHVGHACL